MIDRKHFFDTVRHSLFGGSISQKQVDKIGPVLDGLDARHIDKNKMAYILATAFHESDRFNTLREYASGAAYEGRRDLGNTQLGDGKRYKGRGYVQITGRRNYVDWKNRLGVDIVANPDLAADPEYAVPILIDGMLLGTFTGKALGNYVSGAKVDFKNARRVVNGTDRASLIAGYAQKFKAAIREVAVDEPDPEPDTEPKKQPSKAGRNTAIIAALGVILAALGAYLGIPIDDLIKEIMGAVE